MHPASRRPSLIAQAVPFIEVRAGDRMQWESRRPAQVLRRSSRLTGGLTRVLRVRRGASGALRFVMVRSETLGDESRDGLEAALKRTDECALLLIDMQKDFCDPAFARRDVTMTGEMMPRLRELLTAARKASVHVIHIRTEHPEATNSEVYLRGPKWDSEYINPPCRPGTPGAEFMPGFEPEAGEAVVVKNRYSGFIATNLDLILRSLRIRTIVTAGVQTNNCVEATARDGMMLDYHLVFVSDATATYDRNLHEASLQTIRTHYGEVVATKELMSWWRRLAGTVVPVAAAATAGSRR